MADTLSQKTKSGDFDWPTTSDDHENMEKWVYNEEVLGTFAQANKGWAELRNDIREGRGKDRAYYNGGVLYVDTFKPIGEQLEKLKK